MYHAEVPMFHSAGTVQAVSDRLSGVSAAIGGAGMYNLNPAVVAGRIADRPTAQPLAKMAVLTGEVSCAAVGNCRQQRLDVAECG